MADRDVTNAIVIDVTEADIVQGQFSRALLERPVICIFCEREEPPCLQPGIGRARMPAGWAFVTQADVAGTREEIFWICPRHFPQQGTATDKSVQAAWDAIAERVIYLWGGSE